MTFGSSFNTTIREEALKESHRILKQAGFFACMWNNRDLTIPTQKTIESIIKKYYPGYSHGVRREQQANIILDSGLFNHLYYFEQPREVKIDLEPYIDGWRSVKNKFWDLNTQSGRETLELILNDIRKEFANQKNLKLTYVTRIWIAQKQEE